MYGYTRTKDNFRMSISAFSPGVAIHEYSHRYIVDKKQNLKFQKNAFCLRYSGDYTRVWL
jgi:hypothetical protein